MSNFKGTTGNVFINDIWIENESKVICKINGFDNESEENAELIKDAFNVRQQINCDLQELLKQRNEAIDIFKLLMEDCTFSYDELKDRIKILIKKL